MHGGLLVKDSADISRLWQDNSKGYKAGSRPHGVFVVVLSFVRVMC